MRKAKEGMLRFRVFFDDHRLINNSEISDGLGRCWLLLKPSIVTFADLASHLRAKFGLRNRLVLFIDDFVLPPFESTCILKDKDIIRVKLKSAILKDNLLPCDGQNIALDPQIVRSHGLSLKNIIMTDEISHANLQGNGSNENVVHDDNLFRGIGVLEPKREHSLELHNSVRKRQKLDCTENRVTSVGIQDIRSRQNRTSFYLSGDSKMEIPLEDKICDDGLVVALPVSEVPLGEPSSSMSCKGRQQYEGINNALESEPHLTSDVTKEYVQSSTATSKNNQNQSTVMILKEKTYWSDVHNKKSNDSYMKNHASIDRKPEGDSHDNKAKIVEYKINFSTLFPLTRSPLIGDILAYRYVESLSTVYPILSLPKTGKVSAFDYKSSEIVLVPAPEFEVFLEENLKIPHSLPTVSPYKEDGSLDIKLSALFDVRLLKAHNSKELAYSADINKWNMASAKNNWNQCDGYRTGSENGTKYAPNERASGYYDGANPAETFFWKTFLSKFPFVKGAKSFSSEKY